jgi:hypothetical protein
MAQRELRIMVSSTFDLPEHRKAVIDAIRRAGSVPLAMEYGSATPDGNAIVFSREMVEQSDVYVGIFANRYGSIVDDPELNPQRWSVTEHEYRRATELGKKTLIYFIHTDHPVKVADVDTEAEPVGKLRALKDELAGKHVSAFFSSPDNLAYRVFQSLGELNHGRRERKEHLIPKPPALYAVPPYTMPDEFIGRQSELDALDQWAASDQTVMVYEAIGGMGKSALTWEWTRKHAAQQIPDFAGCVWWSFYDSGSSLRGFLRHAVAYVQRRDPEELRAVDDWEAAQVLMGELEEKPYLLVLDGFERILSAYHQMHKAQIPDEKVRQDLRQCINPADDDLTRYLVDCRRSKILISTRLMPRMLESLRRVIHYRLKGLDGKDAESLARGKGIKGTSRGMLEFAAQLDYHPLAWRVVCGMAKDPPHRGDFDKWLADPLAGGRLELANLDLKQRHTHVLAFALAGLQSLQRRLLSRVSVLSDSAAYETIKVLSPFGSEAEFYTALKNLEDRGLLQWESTTNTYDLHPVVRASAYQLLEQEDREPTYNTLRNHFAALPPENLENATDLSDVKNSVEVLRLLLGAGQLQDAEKHFCDGLAAALLRSVGAYRTLCLLAREILERAGPKAVKILPHWSYINNALALALSLVGDKKSAGLLLAEAIRVDLLAGNWNNVATEISNFVSDQDPALQRRGLNLAVELLKASGSEEDVVLTMLDLAISAFVIGKYDEARELLAEFADTPPPATYQAGNAERVEAELSFRDGTLNRELLDYAESCARRYSTSVFSLMQLRILQAQWELRLENLLVALRRADEAIATIRRSGWHDTAVHAIRAVALAKLGKPMEARESLVEGGRNRTLLYDLYAAEAYIVLGEPALAREYVVEAYIKAWASGPPFSYHWELERCRALMKQLGDREPQLPPFDTAKLEKLPHEDAIRAAIEKLNADKEKQLAGLASLESKSEKTLKTNAGARNRKKGSRATRQVPQPKRPKR